MSAISTLGVLGAGQMGAGIAQVAAVSGCQVILVDTFPNALEKGRSGIDGGLGKLASKGKMTAEEASSALQRIRFSARLEDLSQAQAIVEAVPEDEELKKKIFKQLDTLCTEARILASNTSSISITRLAAVTARPERVIGMHFMNPVPLMTLVEIITGLATSKETLALTRELAERMGKAPVQSTDAPGFIVNRILIPMINEACLVLQEGIANQKDVDEALKRGANFPMGPFELADLIGLDTVLAIMNKLHSDIGDDKYRPAVILKQYVAAGRLGRKSGAGFYEYPKK